MAARFPPDDAGGMNIAHESLRRGRVSTPGQVYLVTFTTYQRRRLFWDFVVAAAACRCISDALPNHRARLLAWVLMPDHWHGLVELGDLPLGTCVQRLKGTSARRLRREFPRLDRIWAPAFHDRALRRHEEVRAAARYLVANPLRAGLVTNVRDYPFWDAVWLEPNP